MKQAILKAGAAVAFLAGSLILASGTAGAASCTGGNATYTLGPDPVSVLQCGIGNINGSNNDGFLNSAAGATYDLIFKNDDANKSPVKDAIVGLINGPNNLKGNWTLNTDVLGGWTDFAIGLKAGSGYAVFSLNDVISGNWEITKGLSHANLYGVQVQAVPLPAAAWLFGSALLGLAGAGYRRKLPKSA